MKKNSLNYVLIVIGLSLLVGGLILLKTNTAPQGIFLVLPYLCIGWGCGLFGGGMGSLLGNLSLKKHPELKKQKEIEEKDERNRTISERSKARAYDIMIFVFGALMIAFSLMNVEIQVILLLVFSYLFVTFYGIYQRYKLEKEI
ncbi:MAG: DUF2178 domain-containing protein [Lachnospiraceae bacterium]|nr:DUF2178 domain-containing protein [Lachnospiraceae bacterium]MBR4085491.1 DUF2178 domain-containing protein [Lachnospiraceae bacterium]